MTNELYTAEGILRVNKRMNTERGPNVNRNVGKFWWGNVVPNLVPEPIDPNRQLGLTI